MSSELVVSSSAQIARVEIDSQVATAKQYPRDVEAVLQEATAIATMTQEIAQGCRFRKPVKTHQDRQGNTVVDEWVEGKSIRLAEILLSSWGNIRAATRIVEVSEKRVVVEAAVHDLEKNVACTQTFSKSIVGRYGRYKDSMVELTIQAAFSFALRNAVFKVVPQALAEVVATAAAEKAQGDRVDDTLDRLLFGLQKRFAVEPERALRAVGCTRADQVTPELLDQLISMATAVQDKEVEVSDAFPSASVATSEESTTAQWAREAAEV